MTPKQIDHIKYRLLSLSQDFIKADQDDDSTTMNVVLEEIQTIVSTWNEDEMSVTVVFLLKMLSAFSKNPKMTSEELADLFFMPAALNIASKEL